MPDAPDLTQLLKHLTELAQPHGFLVDVQISHEIVLPGISNGDPHVLVLVHNMCKVPPLTVRFYVAVRQLERGGVHVFDAHMADAFHSLSAL